MRVGSWMIVNKKTGKAIAETFSAKVAAAINLDRYDVTPAAVYLASLNNIKPE